jgi:hypothetical protein
MGSIYPLPVSYSRAGISTLSHHLLTLSSPCGARTVRVYTCSLRDGGGGGAECHTMRKHERSGLIFILAWIVILSVYGADTIAKVKSLIDPFLR